MAYPAGMTDYTCPRCLTPLDDTRAGAVRVYPCGSCGGHAITLSQLRSVSETARFQAFWQAARAAAPAALSCPACSRPMRAARVRGVEIDACVACHLVWMDPGEQEKLAGAPSAPPPSVDQAADHQLARQLLAIEQVAATREQRGSERRTRRAVGVVGALLELMWWV